MGPAPGRASPIAPAALVLLVVAAPWAMGAVTDEARRAVTLVSLAAAAAVLLAAAARGTQPLPALPLWPLAGFLGLAALQLVPLPAALHALVAPGSHAIWHPADPVLASVLPDVARPVSLDPATTLSALSLVFGLGLLAVLAAPALAAPAAAARAVSVAAAGGLLLALYAIYARSRFGSLLYGQIAVPTIAPFGPFVSKNHFAGFVVMAALLTAGLALGLADAARREQRDWTRGARGGLVMLAFSASLAMALAALASLSRGGALALAAGALALVALRAWSGGPRALAATFAVALALASGVAMLLPPEAHARLRSLSGASFRLDTWQDALPLATASPLVGHGLGAFHDAYPRLKRRHGLLRVEHAENDYLETLAETGLLGLGFALAGLALLFARAAPAGTPPVVRGVAQGALAGLGALAAHSTVDFNLRIPSNAALAALLLAAAAAGTGSRRHPAPRLAAALLAVVSLVLLASTARAREAPWLGARLELQAAAQATLGEARRLRLERAEVGLRRALASRPAQAESWLLLAHTERALGRPDRARVLASHALELDPQRTGLAEAVAAISAAPVAGR